MSRDILPLFFPDSDQYIPIATMEISKVFDSDSAVISLQFYFLDSAVGCTPQSFLKFKYRGEIEPSLTYSLFFMIRTLTVLIIKRGRKAVENS